MGKFERPGSTANPAVVEVHKVDVPMSGDPDPAAGLSDDEFSSLRTELECLDAAAVSDRVSRFEHVNAVLAAELAALDEV